MSKLFITVLLMSATCALLVLCLLLLRPMTKKCFNAAWHYRIYMLVVLFLLVPIGIVGGSFLAGIPNAADPEFPNVPVVLNKMITVLQNNIIPQHPQDTLSPTSNTQAEPTASSTITLNMILPYMSFVWIIGALVFIIWKSVQLVRFKRKIKRTSLEIEDIEKLSVLKNLMTEMKIKGRIHLFSNNIVKTPMLVGLLKTYLILPEVEMSNRELAVILKHEIIHFKRCDLWMKSLALVATAIHWFNPTAYWLKKNMDTFCELSCDEQVVSDMSIEERRFYGETILNVLCRVVSQQSGVYATFAESKKGIERRLTHMMNVRKYSKRMALISFIVAALLCLMGCTVASVMNTVTSPSMVVQTWQDAYAGFLRENIPISEVDFDTFPDGSDVEMRFGAFSAGGYPVTPFFYIYDIDIDGIPELIYIDAANGYDADVYTYKNHSISKISSIKFYPFGGLGIPLDKTEGLYSNIGYKGDYGEIYFYTINSGVLTRQMVLEYNNQSDLSPSQPGLPHSLDNFAWLDYYEVSKANITKVIYGEYKH